MPDIPATWLADFTVNTTTTNLQYEPRIVQLSNGNILIAWTSADNTGAGSPSGTDIIGKIYDPLGNLLTDEFRLNQGFFVDNERSFDIAALDDGRFVIVYEDENGILDAQAIIASEWSSTPTGTVTNTANRTIATTPDAGDIVQTPTVSAASDGSYTVAFQFFDSSTGTHLLNYANVAGGVVGTPTTAISGANISSIGTATARLTSGNIVLVHDWATTDYAIAFAVRNPVTGVSIHSADFVSNTATNGATDFGAAVVALTGGGFVIAWSSRDSSTDVEDTDIQFQRYDNDGFALGSTITVGSSGLSDNNNEVELVALADGGFLVLWDDDEAGQLAGRGQRYDALGNAVGSVFFFDSSNANHTDAVLLADGRVALTWHNTEIHAAILDTRDAANTTGVYSPDTWQVGTIGNDTIIADAAIVHGYDGNDTITGGAESSTIYGGEGNDTINGGPGSDSMHGGPDNDVYIVDNVGDEIFELVGEGIDGVVSSISFTLPSFVENIQLTGSANINATGNSDANRLIGNSGNNILNGMGGVNFMQGLAGNDVYFVDSLGESVVEAAGQGIDGVVSTITYTLPVNVENLQLIGTANINGFGNAEINRLIGNSGNNTLNGLAGADIMQGLNGNDVYWVDDVGDSILETSLAGSGIDGVITSVNYTLAVNVENLSLGGASTTGVGNASNNTITGNGLNNVINGLLGYDVLIGGGGDDKFIMNSSITDGPNFDYLKDFNDVGNDEIRLENAIYTALTATGFLSANLFKDIGTGAQDADDVILYNSTTGALFYDANGLAAGGIFQFAVVDVGTSVTAADFFVI